MMNKQIYKLFFFMVIFIYSIKSFGTMNKCQQVVTISFQPKNGVRIYNINGGNNDRRGVIDLGHFNQTSSVQRVEVGSVEVGIEMLDRGNVTDNRIEIPIINPSKLQDQIKNNIDITNFISGSTATTKVTAENFTTILKEGPNENGVYVFRCNGDHSQHVHQFKYRFDLIFEITPNGAGMYGVSIKKNNGGNTYLDIKELVLNQLKSAQQ